MADNLVEIIIKAVDQASGVIKNTTTQLSSYGAKLNDVSRAVTGFDATTIASTAGIGLLVQQYKKAIEGTMEYAYQVRTLSRDIGGTPEDISKLIQAADDAQVGFETLKNSMVMANKQGIDVTIEGMSRLAEQYLAIQDPLNRTRFLTDTFGRSGEQLGALMEMGAAGIEAAGIEAAKYGRILNESAIKQTEKFRVAQDNLDDSLSKMKDTMALEVMPSLSTLISTITPVIQAYNAIKDAVNSLDPALQGITKTFYGFLDPINAILGPIKWLYEAIVGLNDAIKTLNGTSVNIPSIYTSANPTAMGIKTPTTYTQPKVMPKNSGANTNNTIVKTEKFANGGSFTVPGSYGYEGFGMGGVATASAGETVNVSRNDTMGELLTEMQGVRRGLASLPRELSVAILERAGQLGMS